MVAREAVASGGPGAAPSERRLVVHVGTPKTGTTTIQRALAALEPQLRQRGVCIPAAGRRGKRLAIHVGLRQALKARVPVAPFAGLSRAQSLDLMEFFAVANAAFARECGIGDVLFRDPVVEDDQQRPNVAQWHDLEAGEQRAVREYVQRTAGVDPAPRLRRRTMRALGGSRLGSTRWFATQLADPRTVWLGIVTLARRFARQLRGTAARSTVARTRS